MEPPYPVDARETGGSMAADTVAVLPLGATEQHGAHLPPETDWIIAEGIAKRMARALPADFPAMFLPVERIGYSPEHLDFPGTVSLPANEAIQSWTGTGLNLAKQGIRRLLLLNAHGGNSPLMTIVATELRVRAAMLCVATSWTRFGYPEGLIEEEETLFGMHGGEIETSVMLALRPDLVDMSRAGAFDNYQREIAARFRYLRAYGRHAMGWKIQDLNPAGVAGNAAGATREKGEALIGHAVAELCELATEMRQFDLEHFDCNGG